jgi:hypothetical protein
MIAAVHRVQLAVPAGAGDSLPAPAGRDREPVSSG